MNGVIGADCWAVMPVGSLGAGYAAGWLGLTATLLVVGVGSALTSLVPLLGGPWRATRRPWVATRVG